MDITNRRYRQDEVVLESLDGIIVDSLLKEKRIIIPDYGYLELKELPDKKTVLFKSTKKGDPLSSHATKASLLPGELDSLSFHEISRLLKNGKNVILPKLGVFRIVNLDDASQRILFTPSSHFRDLLNAKKEEMPESKKEMQPIVTPPVIETPLETETPPLPSVQPVVAPIVVEAIPDISFQEEEIVSIEEETVSTKEDIPEIVFPEDEIEEQDIIKRKTEKKRFRIRFKRAKSSVEPEKTIIPPVDEPEVPVFEQPKQPLSEKPELPVIIEEEEPIIIIEEPKKSIITERPQKLASEKPQEPIVKEPVVIEEPVVVEKPIIIEETKVVEEPVETILETKGDLESAPVEESEIKVVPEVIGEVSSIIKETPTVKDSPKVGDVLIPEYDEEINNNKKKVNLGIIVRIAIILVIVLLIGFIVFKRSSDKDLFSGVSAITRTSIGDANAIDLLSMAEKEYGNSVFWVYIYEANRDKLKSPVNIPEGTPLYVPDLRDYHVDISDSLEIKRAILMAESILK